MSINRIYCATSLTGGGDGALDSIDGTNLIDLDMELVINQTSAYIYSLDEDSGAAESSPSIISPDDNAGDKRWIIQKLETDVLILLERSSDPTQPSEGETVIWMSDGTGKGDDGDVMIAGTAGGSTKYGTLFDHSGGAAW